jgi:hypothetical protein
VSLDYSDIRGVITQGGGLVTTSIVDLLLGSFDASIVDLLLGSFNIRTALREYV